jgi:hypothetical protein
MKLVVRGAVVGVLNGRGGMMVVVMGGLVYLREAVVYGLLRGV